MRSFDLERSAKDLVGPIQVARWEQFRLGRELPFQAMWYTVPPGASCPRDQHPEPELSLVVTGCATVEADGGYTEIAAGSAFLLNSAEPHTVHNRGTEPLLVFSAYWMPESVGADHG